MENESRAAEALIEVLNEAVSNLNEAHLDPGGPFAS